MSLSSLQHSYKQFIRQTIAPTEEANRAGAKRAPRKSTGGGQSVMGQENPGCSVCHEKPHTNEREGDRQHNQKNSIGVKTGSAFSPT